jgi:Tol biopolymer transport system component
MVVDGTATTGTGPRSARRLTRLTFDPGLQTDPTFSPDGQFIAYASNRSGNFDIWMQPLAGVAAVQLTTDPADDTQPDWSPDGGSIAFRSERDGGGIFVVSPTDRHVEQLSRAGYRPRWSPDGSKLAFADSIDTSAYLVAGADGGRVMRVTLPTWEDRGFSIAAGWHPSGRLVFLHGYAPRLGLAVFTPGTSATVPQPLPTTVRDRFVALSLGVENGQPLSWTADGRILYFVGEADGVKGIWRLTVDSGSLSILGGPDPVTTAAGWNLMPTTSRTGVRMAFSAATPSLRVWLFALNEGRRVSAAPPRW